MLNNKIVGIFSASQKVFDADVEQSSYESRNILKTLRYPSIPLSKILKNIVSISIIIIIWIKDWLINDWIINKIIKLFNLESSKFIALIIG